MKRNIESKLQDWRNNPGQVHVCLIEGLRGTGKTYLAREFAEANFNRFLYIDPETDPVFTSYVSSFSSDDICACVASYFGMTKELLRGIPVIIDEITCCDRAVDMINRFCAVDQASDAPYFLITSSHRSSRIIINDRIISLTLKPFGFDEYLLGIDRKWYRDVIIGHFEELKAIPDILSSEISELFDDFLLTGGMPSAINELIKSESTSNLPEIMRLQRNNELYEQLQIYGNTAGDKARSILEVLHSSNGKSCRFRFSDIRKGATYNMYSDAIDNLVKDRCLNRIDRLEGEGIALYNMSWAIGNPDKDYLQTNYLITELSSNKCVVKYWESEGKAKINTILCKDEEYIPVEIISDSKKVTSKSIYSFESHFRVPLAYRLNAPNFERKDKIICMPIFATFCLK